MVIDRMHAREMTICYGMTETSPVSFHRRPTTIWNCGSRPSAACTRGSRRRSSILSTGRPLPRGREGELCIRGYLVMRGYWERPDETRRTIDPAGWLRTGDLAVMREDGAVSIVGRLKDMIIRGGENVYPREIEEFLFTNPKIADVQVIGVPDPKYGEAVCAWIQLHPGEEATEDEIREFCRGQIATYKIPAYVRFTDEFPMTVTGKIQKYRMRELTIEELGLGETAPTA